MPRTAGTRTPRSVSKPRPRAAPAAAPRRSAGKTRHAAISATRRAVAEAAQREQREAEHRVDEQHVARPEQHRVDEADDEQKREPAGVDVRRAMRARRGAEPRRARRFGGVEPRHLDREADAEHEAEEQVELAGEQQLAQPDDERVERRLAAASGRANSEWLKPGMFIMKMPSNAKPRSTSSAAMRSARGERRFGVVARANRRRHSRADGIANAPRRLAAARRARAEEESFDVRDRHRRQPAQALLARRDREALAGVEGERRRARARQGRRDAALAKVQEDAGIDIVGDGEQSRQHFVHGFLAQVEGIDFEHKVKMGIRNNRYDAMVPQVVGPLRLAGRVHATEARLARAHTDSAS